MDVNDWNNLGTWASITGISIASILGFFGRKLFGSKRAGAAVSEMPRRSRGIMAPLAAGLVAGDVLAHQSNFIDWSQVDVSSAVDATVASGGILAEHIIFATMPIDDPSNIIDHLDTAVQIVSSIHDATGG